MSRPEYNNDTSNNIFPSKAKVGTINNNTKKNKKERAESKTMKQLVVCVLRWLATAIHAPKVCGPASLSLRFLRLSGIAFSFVLFQIVDFQRKKTNQNQIQFSFL